MYANRTERAGRRRGVVLVLILGMLGLLALIGVTFATFSNQAKIGAEFYSQSVNTPDSEQVIDFALDQLINDTGNPASTLRGHSLKRDMYGNDAVRQRLPQTASPSRSDQPLTVTSVHAATSSSPWPTPRPYYVITTNIPTDFNTAAIRQRPAAL